MVALETILLEEVEITRRLLKTHSSCHPEVAPVLRDRRIHDYSLDTNAETGQSEVAVTGLATRLFRWASNLRMSWSTVKFWFGKLLNLAGYPGLVRECEYHSRALNAVVKARKLELFTIVTVNGLDVYFNRFTGTIDGVGANPTSRCSSDASPESIDPDGLSATPHPPAHMRKIAG
jgi:hypothetical protein